MRSTSSLLLPGLALALLCAAAVASGGGGAVVATQHECAAGDAGCAAAAQPFVLLFLALLIDAVVGDMRWFFRLVPHPIVLVGRLIGFLDDKLNRSKRGKAALLIQGCIVTVLVTGLATALRVHILEWYRSRSR